MGVSNARSVSGFQTSVPGADRYSSARRSSGRAHSVKELLGEQKSIAGQVSTSSKPAKLEEKALTLIQQFELNWRSSESQLQRAIQKLPVNAKNLFQLQRQVYQVGLQSELIARVGETANSTVKRVQQMGSN